jgi:hypothetical protein
MEVVSITTNEAVINVNPSSPPAPKQPSYTPQFSSEGSAILRRLNDNSQLPNGQGSGTIFAANLKATLPIPTPTKQSQSITLDSFNGGVKRKRDESSSKIDFTKSTIPFPWKGPSPTQQSGVQNQSTVQEAQCSRCKGTTGPLVTCISCLTHWHRKCHSPVIGNGLTLPSDFTCASCTISREQTAKLRGRVSQQRQQEIDRIRQKRLSSLPRGVVPAKSHLVGFGAGQASHISVGTIL